MKAIVIDPVARSVEPLEIAAMEEISRIVGYDSLIFEELGKTGDRMYFDEDCFLRGTSGRFQLDVLAPIAGKAVVVGMAGETLRDAASGLEDLRSRIRYL